MIEVYYDYQYTDKSHPNWVENGGADTDRDALVEKDRTLLSWYPAKCARFGDIVLRVLSRLNAADFLQIMQLRGAAVKYYKPTIAILNENINNPIPEGLPNRVYPSIPQYVNELGTTILEVPERIKTWNEWLLNLSRDGVYGGYTCNEVEGTTYYGTNGVYKGLQAMSGAELMLLHNSEDVTLVDNEPVIEQL